MGRLFRIDLEGPVYKCKHCQVEFFVYDPLKKIPYIEYPANLGKLYIFMKCFNVAFYNDGEIDDTVHPVFCIGCGSYLGWFYKGKDDDNSEGNFYINSFRRKR